MQLNEMSDVLKKADHQGFIFRIFSGQEEHNPPHFHLLTSDGEDILFKGEKIRIYIPRYTKNIDTINEEENLTIDEIVTYTGYLSKTVKKKLLNAFNYKRRKSKRGKMIWVELILDWNTYHKDK